MATVKGSFRKLYVLQPFHVYYDTTTGSYCTKGMETPDKHQGIVASSRYDNVY